MVEWIRVASYAVIVEDERVLLCRLSSEVPNSVGKWTLPGGGLDFGESPERAAVREVKEETGLEIRITGLADVNSEVFYFPTKRMQAIRIMYRAETVGGELKDEAVGSTDLAQWFSREEALRLPLVDVAKRGVELAFGVSLTAVVDR